MKFTIIMQSRFSLSEFFFSANSLFYFKAIVATILCLVFIAHAQLFVDPDFGWHQVVARQTVEEHHVVRNDTFTYTMPGHRWTDQEWLSHVVYYFAARVLTYPELSLLAAIAYFIPIFFWIKRSRTLLHLVFTSIAAIYIAQFVGVRPQLFSFLFFFGLTELCRYYADRKSLWVYFVFPIYFFIWANFHAGFALGLVYLLILYVGMVWQSVRDKHPSFFPRMIILGIISGAATFINPFGVDLWGEVFLAMTSHGISYIQEWQSGLTAGIFLPICIGILVGLTYLFHHNANMRSVVPTFVLMFFFVEHARIGVFFYIVAIPYLFWLSEQFEKASDKTFSTSLQITRTYTVVLLCILLIVLLYASSPALVREESPSVQGAVRQLTAPPLRDIRGNVFNSYGIGGEMIANAPSRKVFIDGRMPHWIDENGYSAMNDHVKIMYPTDQSWKGIFAHYHITIAILRTPESLPIFSRLAVRNTLIGPIAIKLISLVHPPAKLSIFTELSHAGWCKYYEDEHAAIYVSPELGLCNKKHH